jgi:hypothetical protein
VLFFFFLTENTVGMMNQASSVKHTEKIQDKEKWGFYINNLSSYSIHGDINRDVYRATEQSRPRRDEVEE